MDLRLRDKKAIVTGGSRGMGKAIARQLAREGCDVAIGARTEEPLREAARDIAQETGRTIVPLVVDTLDADSIKTFVRQAAEMRSVESISLPIAPREWAGRFRTIWNRLPMNRSSRTSKKNFWAITVARARLHLT